MTDLDDRYDQLCTECGMGRYHETSIHDDWDGVLHCTNKECNHEVKRYKSKDNLPPKPEIVKLSPAAQAVRHAAICAGPELEGRLVAALRAAANRLLKTNPWHGHIESTGVNWSSNELFMIAEELEN
jgi:hypothetical protein